MPHHAQARLPQVWHPSLAASKAGGSDAAGGYVVRWRRPQLSQHVLGWRVRRHALRHAHGKHGRSHARDGAWLKLAQRQRGAAAKGKRARAVGAGRGAAEALDAAGGPLEHAAVACKAEGIGAAAGPLSKRERQAQQQQQQQQQLATPSVQSNRTPPLFFATPGAPQRQQQHAHAAADAFAGGAGSMVYEDPSPEPPGHAIQ